MKDILKRQLFNHRFLVSEKETDPASTYATRYLLAKTFGIRIVSGEALATPDMVPFAAQQLGKDVPEPFYRGFPDSVRALTPDGLLFDQVLHYVRTYGLGDFSRPGHSLLETFIERTAFNEETEDKDFMILSEQAAKDKLAVYVENILSSTRPTSEDRFTFLCEYIREYNHIPCKCASKNLAIRLLLEFRDPWYAQFIRLPDVIKLVDELHYQEYGGKDIRKLNLKNQDRKFITAVLDHLLASGNIDLRSCCEKKALWAGLLHHIHYKPFDMDSARFVVYMRGDTNLSVYSEFERAMDANDIRTAATVLQTEKGSGAVARNLSYLVSRANSKEDIAFVLDKLENVNGILLLQLLMKYAQNETVPADGMPPVTGRIFKYTRHSQMFVHYETAEETQKRRSALSAETAEFVRETIQNRVEEYFHNRLGKVFIDPDMECMALPLQENTAFSGYGVLAKGTRLPIGEGKKIRAFTYWEKVDDIDLSMIGITSDGQEIEFSWRTMAFNQSAAITFSGDETSGYYGGAEYFDVDLEIIRQLYPKIEYLIFCDNVFSDEYFCNCICCAGYMLRDTQDSGEIFEPKAVATSFTVNCNSTFAYLFAIDVAAREFIWLNIAIASSSHIAGENELGFLKNYFSITSVMNIKSFFTMLAAEVVDSPKAAEVIVSDRTINITENQEIIRSYDFERIMALMA